MNATETEIFLWIVLGIPAIIAIIYVIYVMISSLYYGIAEIIKERRKRKKEKKKMTIQEIISNLVKNRWSYGDIAKQAGVSKATISRWHKGTVKANKTLEEIVEKNLKDYVDRDKFDTQAGVAEYFLKHFEHPIMVIRSENDTIQAIEEIDGATLDKHIAFCEKRLAELKAQKEKNKWKFTEDEKVILRNLPKEYKWLVRTQMNNLYVFSGKPQKDTPFWKSINKTRGSYYTQIMMFNHLFQCIQWSDAEPCEFRKFI